MCACSGRLDGRQEVGPAVSQSLLLHLLRDPLAGVEASGKESWKSSEDPRPLHRITASWRREVPAVLASAP